ncbi:MAG: hypothetical protein L6Q81_16750 [Bacteroidia bacterium]|nr:hypothetical protein [Bacteroidia bacterium]
MKTVHQYLSAMVLLLILSATEMIAQDTTAVAPPKEFCILYMKNGAKVVGVVVEEPRGKIVVQDPVLGLVTLNEDHIESRQTAKVGFVYTFVMTSGKRYTGELVDINPNALTVTTKREGVVVLSTVNLVDITTGGIADNFSDQFDHGSRYLFAPSAIPLHKGEGYYHNYMILMNGFRYGITDEFSVGGGIIAPLGFYADAKYGRQLGENVHAAIGGLVITTPFLYGLGCGFGSVTFGSRQTNVTLSAGYGAVSAGGDWEATRRPILNLSGMWRLGDNFSLLTENYFMPLSRTVYTGPSTYVTENYYHPQLSLGFRIGGIRHTFDIAATTIGDVGDSDYFVIPFVAYSYRFTNKKVYKGN